MPGSLQQIKNRKGELTWRCQWREPDSPHPKSHTIGLCREMGRAAAKTAMSDFLKDRVSKREASTGLITVSKFVRNDYLQARSAVWKRSTEVTTTALIERYNLPVIGDKFLAAVTRLELQELLNEMAGRLSKQVVTHTRYQLGAIFKTAAGDGQIKINPTDGLLIPRCAIKRIPPEVGDRCKIARAVASLETRDRLFLLLAAWRGMRPGEISALKVGDIRGGLIHVERRVYMGVIDEPKSDLGSRTVPVGTLGDLLEAHTASLPENGPEAWLFPSENGKTPISYKNLYQRRLQPVLKAAGLKKFNYQAMRVTFNTECQEVEPDAKVRADIMGHKVDVNEHVYRQSTEEQRGEAIRRLDEDRLQ